MLYPTSKYLQVQQFAIYLVSLRAFLDVRFVFNYETRKVEYLQHRPLDQGWQVADAKLYDEASETLLAYHLTALLNPEPRHVRSNHLPVWANELTPVPLPTGLRELDGESLWNELCGKQNWDENSQIIHLEGFLRDKGLFAEFAEYADAAAEEENQPCAT